MIEFNLGLPGSGKTYKSVYALYANFGLNEKFRDKKLIFSDIDFAYSNINELKLDCFRPDSVLKLDWDLFYANITLLHAHYLDKKTDTELIVVAQELGLFRCLFIIDECQNYFDVADKVLIWWLSYHRHFHQQIYLISQNLATINSKYKSFSEIYYVARPSSLKIFRSKMVYFQYTSSRLTSASKSAVLKIPFVNEIFTSYHSGANQKSKSLTKKYILISSFFLILTFSIFYGIKVYFSSAFLAAESYNSQKNIKSEPVTTYNVNNPSKNNELNNSQISTTNTIPAAVISDEKLYKFTCFKSLCYYKIDSKNDFIIPSQILSNYLADVEPKNIYHEFHGIRFTIYVMSNSIKFNFLKNGVQTNEQNQNTIIDSLPSMPK